MRVLGMKKRHTIAEQVQFSIDYKLKTRTGSSHIEQPTDFKVEHVIGANGFTPILKEFLDVDLNGESLKLLSAKVETPTAVVAATDRI